MSGGGLMNSSSERASERKRPQTLRHENRSLSGPPALLDRRHQLFNSPSPPPPPPPPPHHYHYPHLPHHHPPHHPPPPPHHYHPPPPPPHHFHHHHPPPPPPPHPHDIYEYYYGRPLLPHMRHPRTMMLGQNSKTALLPYEDPMEQQELQQNSTTLVRRASTRRTSRRGITGSVCHTSLSTSEWCRFGRVFGAKLVLEVFGAAGAIWGFSEVVTLRTADNKELWRTIALIVGVIFFVRYLVHAKAYLYEAVAEKFLAAATITADYKHDDAGDSLELAVEDDLLLDRSAVDALEDRKHDGDLERIDPTADDDDDDGLDDENVTLIGNNNNNTSNNAVLADQLQEVL